MGAKSKQARIVRNANEFDLGLLSRLVLPPRVQVGGTSWTLPDIYAARDQQSYGRFKMPARLAEAMRTDDALAVAYENRLAPQRCLPVELIAAKGSRGGAVAGEAAALFGPSGVGIEPGALADINGCLVNHGVAFGINVAVPREDGSRVDIIHRAWPIEWVWWNQTIRSFVTMVDPETMDGIDTLTQSLEVPITHGDGRWTIYSRGQIEPWKTAAILPASLVWARHAFAARDWAKGSVSHGNAKIVGELPAGMPLQNSDGSLNPEAVAFLELLKAIGQGDMPVGIRPAGSKTDMLINNSTAWQVWSELMNNAERSAARIYLGTDGTLGAQGGAPGVDIEALFGVASTRVQGDLEAIERGFFEGVIQPWAAMNFGDSALAPQRRYIVPRGDEDATLDALSKRTAAFWSALKLAHDAGITIDQEYINGIADDFDVRAPVLQAAPLVAPPKPAGDAPSNAAGPSGPAEQPIDQPSSV